jgi:hypothetical protein
LNRDWRQENATNPDLKSGLLAIGAAHPRESFFKVAVFEVLIRNNGKPIAGLGGLPERILKTGKSQGIQENRA